MAPTVDAGLVPVSSAYFLAFIPLVYIIWNWLGPNGVSLQHSPSCQMRVVDTVSHLQLQHIPTVGPSVPILAYLSGLRYIRRAQQILQAGYIKVGATVFVHHYLLRRLTPDALLQFSILPQLASSRWL